MKAVTRPYRMTTRAAAAAETAEKILDATKHLFAENMIAEITLADIAERSGVTVQTILRRFGDKATVFAEAISRLGTEILSQRGRAISNNLDDLLANLVEHYETHGRLVLKMLAEELTTPAVQPALASGRRYHRRWCETVFAATLESLTGADKDRRRGQLVAICDVGTWEVLRIRMGLSRHETRAALREMLQPLIKKV
jgi:AcrR family transcriptional regulator